MPREQRVQLTKGPVTEVAAGTFDSDVVKTQDFARAETALATPGQELAESLGLIAKGAAALYDGHELERKNEEVINWSIYGDQMGRKALEEAAKLPIGEQSDFLKQEFESFMGSFEKHSGGRGVSKEGFQAGLGSISTYIAAGEDSIMKANIAATKKRKISGIHIRVAGMINEGKTPKDVMEYMAGNKDMYFDKQSVTIDYVNTIANDLNAYMVAHPGVDIEPLIKERLLVNTLDGISIYKITAAKDIIDNLRADNRQAMTLFNDGNYKEAIGAIEKNATRNLKDIEDVRKTVDETQFRTLRGLVTTNQTKWQEANRAGYYKDILGGKATLSGLLLALERKEISAGHHESLVYDYHQAIGKKTAAVIHTELTALLIANPTRAKLDTLVAMPGSDGGYAYKKSAVHAAYKQVLTSEYNRLATLENPFSGDLVATKALFANARGVVELKEFDSSLLSIIPSVDGKATPLVTLFETPDITDAAKIDYVQNYIRDTKALISVASSQGYVSKNIAKFEAESGIIQAEMALNGVNGVQQYVQNINQKRGDRYDKATPETIAKNIFKYDPDMTLYDDEEVDAGYLITQAPHVEDIYNLVLNKHGDERMAAEVTRDYIKDNMYKVDVEGSGVVDDSLWVYKGTGITSQDIYNKVTGVLGEAFGMDDDLLLFNTDPTNPHNPTWLFKDLHAKKVYEIQGDMIKDIINETTGQYGNIFKKYGRRL